MAENAYGQLHDAILFASAVHSGMNRDGEAPLPYITHPIDVINLLRYVGDVKEDSILCAAALHDTIEECGVSLEALETRFGKDVSELVGMMTRYEPSDEETADMTKDEIWELRSGLMLKEIKEEMNDSARTIKLADRVSNLRAAMRTRQGKKLRRYVTQSEAILAAIDRKVNSGLWDDLQRLIELAKDGA